MNNVSFKANIEGINNAATIHLFKSETKSDPKHTLTYHGKDKNTGWDIFTLSKDGKITEKYAVIKNASKDGNFSIDTLLQIFNILKIKEALKKIEQSKESKKLRDFNEFMHQLDLEEQNCLE